MLVIFATSLLLSKARLNLVVAFNPMTTNIAKYKNNIGKNRYTTGQLRMKTTKRVYLETNVYCRPLDDQRDSRIHEETEAFLQIVDNVERGKLLVISSDYVKFEIEQIKEMLPMLSEPALYEARDFIQYLLEKQKKRKAFVDRVLKAERETPIRFESVEDAVKAVFDETGD